MTERDANQLAADAVQRLRALIPAEGFHYAWCNARPCTCEAQYDRDALDELVGLVGTLQQERDEWRNLAAKEAKAGIARDKERMATEAALADADRAGTSAWSEKVLREREEAVMALATTRQALTEIERIPYQSGRARGDVAIEIARRALAATGGDSKELPRPFGRSREDYPA